MASFSSDMGQQQLISQSCYHQWMALQEQRLNDLVQAMDFKPQDPEERDARLLEVAQRSIRDFEEYVSQRNHLSRRDVSKYFAPSWNTSLENSLLWIAGCRPSSYIRLVYGLLGAQSSSDIDDILDLDAPRRPFDIGDLSYRQLMLINDLQLKTINEEDKLSTRLAVLQENTADFPIAAIAKGLSRVGESNTEVDRALDEHEKVMAEILEAADVLRLTTLKSLLAILTPVQAVDFLVASKKLHLSMHEWGKKRDHMRGRTAQI